MLNLNLAPVASLHPLELKLIMAQRIANFDVTWPDNVYAKVNADGIKGEGNTQ
jgi:hypothetical protein